MQDIVDSNPQAATNANTGHQFWVFKERISRVRAAERTRGFPSALTTLVMNQLVPALAISQFGNGYSFTTLLDHTEAGARKIFDKMMIEGDEPHNKDVTAVSELIFSSKWVDMLKKGLSAVDDYWFLERAVGLLLAIHGLDASMPWRSFLEQQITFTKAAAERLRELELKKPSGEVRTGGGERRGGGGH